MNLAWPGLEFPAPQKSPAQKALIAAAALSLVLHLAVLSLRLSDAGGRAASTAIVSALSVRVIAPVRKETGPVPTVDTSPPSAWVPPPAADRAPAPARRPPERSSSLREDAPVSAAAGAAESPRPAATTQPAAEALDARSTPAAPAAPASATYAYAMTLNPPPRPLDDINPDFPEAAGTRGGTVVLRLFINETGGVDKIEVVRSAPPGLFDDSALAAFGSARFSPGFLAGVAVKSQVMYEVEFARQARESSASGRGY